jgi:hypothetical protein
MVSTERAEANAATAAMWQARAEMLADQLAQAQRALPTPQERPQIGPTDASPAETTQTPVRTPQRAPWWMPWRRASAL